MATPNKVGNDNPIFQHWSQDFSPTQGVRTTQEWQGINIGKISALARTYVTGGATGSLKFEKNIATLIVKTSDSNVSGSDSYSSPARDIVDKWEVAVDQEKPDLFENQNYLNMFVAADATYASVGAVISQQIAHLIRKQASGENPTWGELRKNFYATPIYKFDGTTVTGTGGTIPMIGEVLSTFSLFQGVKYFSDDYFRGATNFVHSKYVLRHTASAPNTYGNNVSDFNIERLYSIAGLLTECQSNSLWILPLPAYLAYKILNYPVPVTLQPNYYFGALKLRANAILAARNRIEISQEYLIDAWGRHTYPLAT